MISEELACWEMNFYLDMTKRLNSQTSDYIRFMLNGYLTRPLIVFRIVR